MSIYSNIKDLAREIYVSYSLPMKVSETGNKKVLISYIKSPFYSSTKKIFHSNYLESKIISESFTDLGFSVEVVDYRCKRKINFEEYDLIFGFGYPFHDSLDIKKLKKICYLTGSNPNFSNLREAERIRDFKNEFGITLVPRREAYWPWMHAAINSDFLITTGNYFTKSTYLNLRSDVLTIPVPFVPSENHPTKNFPKGILWFGGAGALFKGLDLTIRAFKNLKSNFTLDICGPIESETDFMGHFENEIFKDSRINFHGMLDISSKKMQSIINRNSFVILPSCSEGGASSVLTCMNLGLIPIVSEECSIDLDNFGIPIKKLTVQDVENSINEAFKLEENDILYQRSEIEKFLHRQHTFNSVKEKLKNILQEII